MLSDVVGERIRAARRAAKLSREQVAERCANLGWPAVTASVVNYIETGRPDAQGNRRREVTIDELLALAFALDVPPLHLLAPLSDEPWHGPYGRTPKTSSTAEALAWLRADRPLDPRQGPEPAAYGRIRLYVAAASAAREFGDLLGEWLPEPAPDPAFTGATESGNRPPGWEARYVTALARVRDLRGQLRALGAPLPVLPRGLGWVDQGVSDA